MGAYIHIPSEFKSCASEGKKDQEDDQYDTGILIIELCNAYIRRKYESDFWNPIWSVLSRKWRLNPDLDLQVQKLDVLD